MDILDRDFAIRYADFVDNGGLDQTTGIISEDFERIERQASFCVHGEVKRKCALCTPVPRPLPTGMGGYTP